ncbi:unnamed protein product [Pleuronectes platessa]|uniref:Uncharacterized protein n=1 Tax=Pleuronectes platessa TaxID=8262 RepID=A0A9N7UM78_PLEPL|nr:unnamed protein product [Pleuronectes platessa]
MNSNPSRSAPGSHWVPVWIPLGPSVDRPQPHIQTRVDRAPATTDCSNSKIRLLTSLFEIEELVCRGLVLFHRELKEVEAQPLVGGNVDLTSPPVREPRVRL